ncbi:MAG: hypothetical protein AAB558_04130 [Patescibacteria group bacterium]
MIVIAAICIVIAFGFFLFSFMLERPWLKWWMIPWLVVATGIMWGKFSGVI